MSKAPNFFIVGAPKCGTTSLATWLGEHPNIYMPRIKEPHFYSTDLKNQKTVKRSEYDRLFKNTAEQHHAIGEASVWYLYSKDAILNILSEIPDAKFIVCLRNPVDMAYSLHGQHLLASNEDIEDFDIAWNIQDQRRNNKNIPKLCVDRSFLLYGPACSLGTQLESLYARCNPENVKLVFLNDLKTDAKSEYKKILRFLGLQDDHRTSFPTINSASERRFKRIAQFLKALNRARHRLPIPSLGTGVISVLTELNKAPSARPPMTRPTREKLIDYFLPEIQKLEKLSKRNLDTWKSDQ